MSTAWMLRRDGTAFPCVQHIYASHDCLEETIYAAQWLHEHTLDAESRHAALSLMAAFGEAEAPGMEAAQSLLAAIRIRPYVFLSADFVSAHAAQLTVDRRCSLWGWNEEVFHRLSQEFTRVRLGGMYNTVKGNRDLYFRISSDGFDWSENIRRFMAAEAGRMDTLSIVRDEESTGDSFFYLEKASLPLNAPLPPIR